MDDQVLTPDPAVWERRGGSWYKLGRTNAYQPKVCAQCGVEALMTKQQRFCSAPCRHAAQRGRHRDVIKYRGLHTRLVVARGPASDYVCACGRQAREWSYDGKDPDELCQGSLRFSTKLEHYLPQCRRCHRLQDLGGEKNVSAVLTDAQIAHVLAEYRAGGVTQTELAVKYGVSQSAVSTWVRGFRRSYDADEWPTKA